MKISYIPCHSIVDLHMEGASISKLGTKNRLTMLQEMVRLGYDVELCGVPNKTQLIDVAADPRYECLHHMKINRGMPSEDSDVLFIEGGAQNAMHTRTMPWGGEPLYWFIYESIARHEGKVLWYYPEPTFGLRWEALKHHRTNFQYASNQNYRSFFHSSKRFCENKEFLLLAPINNVEEFRKVASIPDHIPDKIVHYFPHGLAKDEICYPELELKPISELKHDVVYIGHTEGADERHRRGRLINLLDGLGQRGLRVALYGKHSELRGMFEDAAVHIYEPTKNQQEANDILNSSLCALLVQRRDFIRCQHEPTRHLQAAQCGAVTLWDSEAKWMHRYSINTMVTGSTDVEKQVAMLKMNHYRTAEIGVQRSSLPSAADEIKKAIEAKGVKLKDVWKKNIAPYTTVPPTLF